MPEARLRGRNDFGLELRYARSKKHYWPGVGKALRKAGYWIGTAKKHTWIGQSVDPVTLRFDELQEIPDG